MVEAETSWTQLHNGSSLLMEDTQASEVLAFWFGTLDADGLAAEEMAKRWWRKDPALDDQIRQRFGELHRQLRAEVPASWRRSAPGRLAALIVLDQFSRNMFRDTAEMFAADAQALALAQEGIELGMDGTLPTHPRSFCYLPLMHAEDLAVQNRCVELFSHLCDELEGTAQERIRNNVKFAEMHRDIVARFGRFPHRNAILGRASTPAELEFLTQPGSSF